MRDPRFLSGGLAFVLLASTSMLANAGTLEWRSTVAQELSAGVVNQTCYLYLSGLSGISMGSIAGVDVAISDGDAVVTIDYSILPGDTSRFQVAVAAGSPRMRRLLFGKKRVTIWAGEKPCEGLPEGGRKALEFDVEALKTMHGPVPQ